MTALRDRLTGTGQMCISVATQLVMIVIFHICRVCVKIGLITSCNINGWRGSNIPYSTAFVPQEHFMRTDLCANSESHFYDLNTMSRLKYNNIYWDYRIPYQLEEAELTIRQQIK